MYQTQTQTVLEYMQRHKTINSFECYLQLQIVDLQHAIYELRKEGYNIVDKWITKKNRLGKRVKFKEYRLEER